MWQEDATFTYNRLCTGLLKFWKKNIFDCHQDCERLYGKECFILTLMLEEGCQKIEGFPMCFVYRDAEDFLARQTTKTKATTEATTSTILCFF